MKNQADFYVRRKLTFSYQARTNCYVQISLNIYTSQNLIVIFTTRHSLFPLRADLGHSITYLRWFDTNFRRPDRYFSIALKVILSLSDRYEIFTSDWLWIENCQNAVLSKIDITMTTINEKNFEMDKSRILRNLDLPLKSPHQELKVWQ